MRKAPTEFVIELLELFQTAASLNSSLGSVSKTEAKGEHFSRESFACACLACIFFMCSSETDLKFFSEQSRRDIGEVSARIMVERCSAIIKAFLHAKMVSDQLPSRKTSNEELVFVLMELSNLELIPGVLIPKNLKEPIKGIGERSKNVHLIIFYPWIVRLLSCEDKLVLKHAQQILAKLGNELGIEPLS